MKNAIFLRLLKRKFIGFIILSLVSAFLVIFITTAFSIYTYGNQQNNIKADAAIVLGAAVWGNQPSPVFRERINHAIALYKQGYIHTIIFTGGVGESNEPAESIVAKNYALAQAIPEDDILIETRSRTTNQNLRNARDLALSKKLNKFLIVSDPLHMKRSVLMARDLEIDAYPSPTPTTRYRSMSSKLEFLLRETYFYFIYIIFGI